MKILSRAVLFSAAVATVVALTPSCGGTTGGVGGGTGGSGGSTAGGGKGGSGGTGGGTAGGTGGGTTGGGAGGGSGGGSAAGGGSGGGSAAGGGTGGGSAAGGGTGGGSAAGGGTGGGSAAGGGVGGGSAAGGGVGGGVGGGSATGGGAGGGCTTLATWNETVTAAGYDNSGDELSYADKSLPNATTPANLDYLSQVVYYGFGGSVPGNYTFTGAEKNATCGFCLYLSFNCPQVQGAACLGGDFFARGGTYSITTATKGATGSFVSQMNNIRFDEWNFTTDLPVANGRCYIVTSEATNATF